MTQQPDEQNHVLQRIFRQQNDALAHAHAAIVEKRGNPVRLLRHLAIGDATFLVDALHERFVGVAVRGIGQQRAKSPEILLHPMGAPMS